MTIQELLGYDTEDLEELVKKGNREKLIELLGDAFKYTRPEMHHLVAPSKSKPVKEPKIEGEVKPKKEKKPSFDEQMKQLLSMVTPEMLAKAKAEEQKKK